jgi:glutathione peroxidase
MPAITDFTLPALDGGTINLADYAGKPMIITNSASLCNFTGQYAGLQRLWQDYKDKGLLVLAVPSGDFAGQEYKDSTKTAQLCETTFGITFPVAAPTHVVGYKTTPLFRYINKQAGFLGQPRWNFYKYVIGRNGKLVTWFSTFTSSDSLSVRRAIDIQLARKR